MEADMNLFGILGPVMVGPSSSHTAGAARIGRAALRLLGEPVSRAEIGFFGSFARTYHGHGTDRAVVGGLLDYAADDLRLRDSLAEAEARGMTVEFNEIALKNAHPNTVRLRLVGISGKRTEVVAASVGGGNIEVKEIDGLQLGFTGEKHTLIIRHLDTPGMIARVSGLLAEARVNIATMRVSRGTAGGKAIMTLELDELPVESVLDALKATAGISDATMLSKLS